MTPAAEKPAERPKKELDNPEQDMAGSLVALIARVRGEALEQAARLMERGEIKGCAERGAAIRALAGPAPQGILPSKHSSVPCPAPSQCILGPHPHQHAGPHPVTPDPLTGGGSE